MFFPAPLEGRLEEWKRETKPIVFCFVWFGVLFVCLFFFRRFHFCRRVRHVPALRAPLGLFRATRLQLPAQDLPRPLRPHGLRRRRQRVRLDRQDHGEATPPRPFLAVWTFPVLPHCEKQQRHPFGSVCVCVCVDWWLLIGSKCGLGIAWNTQPANFRQLVQLRNALPSDASRSGYEVGRRLSFVFVGFFFNFGFFFSLSQTA